jgi:hypothetical protein
MRISQRQYSKAVTREGRLWIGTAAGLASWKRTVKEPLGRPGGAPTGRLCPIQNAKIQCSGEDGTFGSAVIVLM